MASTNFFPFLLIISLAPSSFSPAIAGDEELADLPCVKELLPCRPYLHESVPPSRCCSPLLNAIQQKAACLCAVFYSEPILMALNLTQAEALMILRICGGYVPDFDSCNGDGGVGVPAPSSATPPTPLKSLPPSQDEPKSSASTPPAPTKPSPPSDGSSPSSSNDKDSAVRAAGVPILAGGLVSVTILALV